MSFFEHTDSLFDIFDNESEVNDLSKIKPPVPVEPIKNIKRTHESNEDSEKDEVEEENGKIKKQKINNIKSGISIQNPILADDFEQNVQKDVKFNIDEFELKEKVKNNENSDNIENINITDNTQHVSLQHQVRHQVALPPNYNYIPIAQHKPSENPARTYPFTLDPFQQCSINCIQRNESVLVSAHTSAGKTVVAEYAIAQGLRDKQRVVYTSPIKALSNQKFRELSQEFGDVGLMTGDVTINPNASCLVMTTEILRSMLYRGSEVMREISWVIFDEIHYMRDKERGVVWEETIILLPNQVHYVFLSATIPNAFQFAEWICKIHEQPCHVVYTDYRPTPLQHYLFPAGGDGIHLAVDEKGVFREDNFQRAISYLGDKDEDSGQKKMKGKGKKQVKGKGQTTDLYKIIKMIMTRNYQPVIVFSFAKRECENNALMLSKLDFNDDEEKEMIQSVYTNAISSLSEDDQQLPQIEHLLPLLKRGIGIHHSGLLPILKEVIEILFQEGLIKVLFATETFAMGVNMPARAVVFSELRKHDGQKFRDLLSNEYIQMSGRAGRRGLDDTGVVIIATLDKLPEIQTINNVVLGKSQKLESQFRLTYNMILNLLRVETLRVEEMIKRSFSENVTQAALPEQQKEYEKNNEILKNMEDLSCVICKIDINLYYNYTEEILNLNKQIHRKIIASSNNQRIFCPGRILIINNEKFYRTIAVILKTSTKIHNNVIMNSDEDKKLIHCLIVHEDLSPEEQIKKLYNPIVNGKLQITEINNIKTSIQHLTYNDIELITSTIIKIDQDSVFNHNESVISSIQQELIRIAKSFNDSNEIEECSWKKLKDIEFQEYHKRKNALLERIKGLKCNNCPDFIDHYNIVSEKKKIEYKINELFKNLSENNLQLLPDYNQRIDVLKYLRYIDDNLTVQLKGKIACEISTADELLLTELVLDNFFAEFDLAESAALLSCFIFQEKSQNEPALTSNLEKGIEKIRDMALNLADIQRSFNIDISTQDYVATVNIGLVEVVYEWAKGVPFKQITELTDVLEGSIVRCIVRLDEVCRQVKNASRIIGDSSLYIKMEKTSELIKRDIVFAQSLYF